MEPDIELSLALTIRLRSLGFDAWSTPPNHGTARLIMRKRPQFVLLDIDAERHSGLELHNCLLTSERTRTIPVIYLTVRDHRTHRALAARYGAASILPRPLEFSTLVKAIRALNTSIRANRTCVAPVSNR